MKVTGLSKEKIIERCFSLIEGKGTAGVVTLNSLMLKYAWKDSKTLRAILSAKLITPDSVGVCYAVRLLDGQKIYRYPGIEMSEDLIKSGRSCYFLGGRPGVAGKAAEVLKSRYPEANIAGFRHGFFKDVNEELILKEIREKKPDILFVGLDMKRQERWIAKNKEKTGAGIVIGVGGSFDVFSGNLRRAPQIFRLTGTEWMWRLRLEPWRLNRILKLPVFALAVFKRYIKKKELLEI
ncbi:MAG: WecB/TagA/CpsF family glycosyltransferase [Elusimicrobia bacterium]|jgi:N-acetylglucosaminyldiphosphoundecaprenol N-acetyl-beta-D-mannosaminyltransferase|nr:WecB/TagA/CpsF family glycosyltransferase [Elusimicrobiota bacterium]